MKNAVRYIRAFFTALRMTARGEKPPPPPHPELTAWARQTVVLMNELYSAADSNGLNKTARQSLILKLDGRPMNVEMIFGTLRYHAAEEYPSLLRTAGRFNRGAIHATNMNDVYWLTRLQSESALQSPAVQSALARLHDHLQTIPKT